MLLFNCGLNNICVYVIIYLRDSDCNTTSKVSVPCFPQDLINTDDTNGGVFVMEKTIWKDIEGYNGTYQISNTGKVRSFSSWAKGRLLSISYDKQGYPRITLNGEGAYNNHSIHRLVAKAFIPNPENKRNVNHIDGVKTNNHASNLEWVTSRENSIHARDNGLLKYAGSNSYNARRVNQYSLNGEFIKKYDCMMDAERDTGIRCSSIHLCCKGKYKRAGKFIWRYAC